jgi:hypothetical protein
MHLPHKAAAYATLIDRQARNMHLPHKAAVYATLIDRQARNMHLPHKAAAFHMLNRKQRTQNTHNPLTRDPVTIQQGKVCVGLYFQSQQRAHTRLFTVYKYLILKLMNVKLV